MMIIVFGESGWRGCFSESTNEGPMVPFGSTCGNQGEALVFNQKATRFFENEIFNLSREKHHSSGISINIFNI